MNVYGDLKRAALETIADPGSTVVGRLWWNSTDGQAKLADGTNSYALLRNDAKLKIGNSGTASQNIRLNRAAVSVLQFVTADDATAEGTLSTSLAQLSFKMETYATGSLPGNVAGRLAWDSTTVLPVINNGSAWKTLTVTDAAQVLTNKTISTASNTIQSGAATSGQVLTADGATGTSWTSPSGLLSDPGQAKNYSLTGTVGSSALTIALKNAAGSDASAGDPVSISFRSSTAATGTYVVRSVTGALSTVISSGSTAGHKDATDEYLYIYAIDNAGTVELAWSSSRIWDEGTRQTTTAEGGAGAADSKTTLYSSTGRTNVAIRFIGRMKSNQTTAGTWAAVPTEISLFPSSRQRVPYSQLSFNGYAGVAATNTTCGYFTNQHTNIGTAMTVVTNDGTSGLDILINEDGIYSFDAALPNVAAQNTDWSITRNASGADLTTGPQSFAWGKRLTTCNIRQAVSATPADPVSGTHIFLAGDHIRMQDGGVTVGTADYGHFNIIQVAKF